MKLKDMPDLFSSKSAIEQYYRCPQSWALKYLLGLNAVDDVNIAAAIGNVLHAGILEGFFLNGGNLTLMQKFAEGHRDYVKLEPDEELMVHCVLKGAEQSFRAFRDQITVISVENKYKRDEQVGDKTVRHSVRSDMVYVYRSGGPPWVMDLKTTGRYLGKKGSKPWYWDRAVKTLETPYAILELEKHLGTELAGMDWQVVKLPKDKAERFNENGKHHTREQHIEWLAGKLGKNTNTWFPHLEIPRAEANPEAAIPDIDYIVRRMLADAQYFAEHGHLGKNRNACWDYARPCEYQPACFEGADINDKKLYSLRTDRKPKNDNQNKDAA